MKGGEVLNYWETEEPLMVETEKNVLKLYREAGKLQVCQPFWQDKDGVERQGKTVTIDLEALYESDEAKELLLQALKQ